MCLCGDSTESRQNYKFQKPQLQDINKFVHNIITDSLIIRAYIVIHFQQIQSQKSLIATCPNFFSHQMHSSNI